MAHISIATMTGLAASSSGPEPLVAMTAMNTTCGGPQADRTELLACGRFELASCQPPCRSQPEGQDPEPSQNLLRPVRQAGQLHRDCKQAPMKGPSHRREINLVARSSASSPYACSQQLLVTRSPME